MFETMTESERRVYGYAHVWSFQAHWDRARYVGIYPRSSQAIRDACLANGVLAFGDDSNVVIMMPKQWHDMGGNNENS